METVKEKIPSSGLETIPAIHPAMVRTPVVNGWERRWLDIRVKLTFLRIALQSYRSPRKALRVIRQLLAFKQAINGKAGMRRCVKTGGKYYFSLYIPGYPSPLFNKYIQTEMFRILPHALPVNHLQVLQLAITSRCPLKCEHCFEWKNLNQEDPFNTEELLQLVKKFGDEGLAILHLTGGEPMVKQARLLEIISRSRAAHEYYILSSGLNLTESNAFALKKSGATGVIISLDHTDPSEHNRFRGTAQAWNNAVQAMVNARQAGLVTALSLCVTRDFISPANLLAYAKLAKELGAGFVQLLEPKAVGHYDKQDVLLSTAELALLEKFYLSMNYDETFRDYPVFLYHGFHQRRLGCMSGGDRILYIDAAGHIDACPFCQTQAYEASAILSGRLKVKDMKISGCPDYSKKWVSLSQ